MNAAAVAGPARRIGLFGGTFDPPHNAHVALARLALQSLALDEVRWIPAGQPWQKARRISAAVHREAMVRLAIEGEPRFVLERCELEREGPSYMIDTLSALRAAAPAAQWVLLIGADQFAGLHSWKDWQRLLAETTIAVANRPGAHADPHPAVLAQARRVVPLPMMEVSSTEIRRRCAAGRSITELVPPAVAGYIARHHLYQDPALPPG